MMLTLVLNHTASMAVSVLLLPVASGRGQVCPVAPAGAQPLVDQFLGWFSWGLVWIAFPAGVLAAVASVILGKIFSMPHVSKGGLIGIFVILGAALLYLVIPGILAGFLGDGCVAR